MPAIGRMGSAIRAKIQPFILTDQGTPLWRFSKTLFRYRVYEKVPQLSKVSPEPSIATNHPSLEARRSVKDNLT
jgi:hypothetical protein